MSSVKIKVVSGKKYGRWTTICETIGAWKYRRVLCECECGTKNHVSFIHLRNGKSKSCGCLKKEKHKKAKTKHGMFGTPEYQAWRAMNGRCYNPNFDSHKHYKEMGITVCSEWREGFVAFYRHVGKRPSGRHSIDRINNLGNYEPGNVRWATPEQQQGNKRTSVIVTYCGESINLAEAARRCGLNYNTVFSRYRKGKRGVDLFCPIK
jgi:hypothetical protein